VVLKSVQLVVIFLLLLDLSEGFLGLHKFFMLIKVMKLMLNKKLRTIIRQ